MIADRYTKGILTVIAVALVLIAGGLWLGRERVARLSPTVAEAQTGPQYETVVPKAWGKIIGYDSGNLLLEASDGTLREVDVRGKAPEYPRIKTLVRWN
jgi:hypothetical protein